VKGFSLGLFIFSDLGVSDVLSNSRKNLSFYDLKVLNLNFALEKKFVKEKEIKNKIFLLRLQLISLYVPFLKFFIESWS